MVHKERQKKYMKSKFLKLNYSHVEYVINCLGKNTTVGQEDKIISMKIGFVHNLERCVEKYKKI
ncbi:MAG: hypothetical protein Q4D76_16800 [Oscillospiraceae bacterium]|nr:hypothetical protein [Oscillospiraceae bacterium]